MKKILILILALTMLFAVTGCGSGDNASSQNNSSTTSSLSTSAQSSEDSKVDEENLENWGVEDTIVVGNPEIGISAIHICLPDLLTINEGPGQVAYQLDNTRVIMGGQINSEIEVASVDEIFPAYFEQLKEILNVNRSPEYADFEFDIDEKKNVEINGYEMCKYKGTHTFTYEGESKTMQYVAYSTFSKENGADVYWLVLDETEDQSLAKTIESHADNMAKTVREDT